VREGGGGRHGELGRGRAGMDGRGGGRDWNSGVRRSGRRRGGGARGGAGAATVLRFLPKQIQQGGSTHPPALRPPRSGGAANPRRAAPGALQSGWPRRQPNRRPTLLPKPPPAPRIWRRRRRAAGRVQATANQWQGHTPVAAAKPLDAWRARLVVSRAAERRWWGAGVTPSCGCNEGAVGVHRGRSAVLISLSSGVGLDS